MLRVVDWSDVKAVGHCFETAIANGCVWHRDVCDILMHHFENRYERDFELVGRGFSKRDIVFQLLKTVCALGCKVSQSVIDSAARRGDLEMFKWAWTAKKRWIVDINCAVEIIGGDGSESDKIEMLKMCFENGYKSFGYHETHAAELNEKYNVLKFLVENGCSWKPQK